MDAKKSPIRRTKRQAKVLEDFWDCSVCTSTRKPRINPQLVAQQVASQFVPASSNQKREKKDKRSRISFGIQHGRTVNLYDTRTKGWWTGG
ncbi:hypothetical protein RN001_000009 [Aquatica leii]|uniref:Uncharacterized protein n=1 Tax=Aquatica leii TaxID=1421715 RepID=A0AAN7SQF0_9COLE|nr:hypothetical protein RN001_000009 [Aquatica leii]